MPKPSLKKSLAAVVLLIVALAASAAGDTQKSDASLAAGLIGKWKAPESRQSQKILGEITYAPDGVATGYSTGMVPSLDGSPHAVRINLKARWKIENHILLVSDIETDPTGVIPQGTLLKYEIVSLSPTELVFKNLKDGAELYRRR
jgi:putative cell wall-binding protein